MFRGLQFSVHSYFSRIFAVFSCLESTEVGQAMISAGRAAVEIIQGYPNIT
jgi:hypothetical protein